MTKLNVIFIAVVVCLSACTTQRLPSFSSQRWHVDASSGHAVSSSGIEVAFGSEWMITDTTLMQTVSQVSDFPKLESHLANGINQFPEIKVDSVLFYNPHRGLLFVTYHQVKPLKPTSEIYLCDDDTGVYSKEYARMFGTQDTSIDDTGWEDGPMNSVYTNVHYRPREKRVVLMQRVPFKNCNIAVFQIWATGAKRGKWRENYPPGTFWNIDLGDTENIERISLLLQSSRNLAVENLKLAFQKTN